MSESKKTDINSNNSGFVRYQVKKQETWYDIVKNQYGIKDNSSIMEVVHKLKDCNNVDYKSTQILPEISLFESVNLDNGENVKLKGLSVEHSDDVTSYKNNGKNKKTVDGARIFFEEETYNLNSMQIEHDTNLLDIAQDSLGTIEVTQSEYEKLSNKQKQRTNIFIIGEYGDSNDSWCAHTVSYLLDKANIDYGEHKKTVSQFIRWANSKDIYRPIGLNNTTAQNYKVMRMLRQNLIKIQLPNMHEGDLIVWKAKYAAIIEDESVLEKKSSHIGIIESVDVSKGIVTVIEGNANVSVTGDNFERKLVNEIAEGRRGAQDIGEWQEVNKRDGIIRKQYKVEDLAAFGYSGYIDMSSLIK